MSKHRIYLLSFPKSGRTWVRLIIGKYFADKYELNQDKILVYSSEHSIKNVRILQHTHGGFAIAGEATNIKFLEDKDVILLERNIYDTMVSYYYHCKYRYHNASRRAGADLESKGSFLKSKHGIKRLKSYYEEISNINFLYKTTYEDLHKTPEKECSKILELMGEDVDKEILKNAIEFCTFENMAKAERENKFKISSSNLSKKNEDRAFKVREGKVNNYHNHFSKDQIDYITKIFYETHST